MPIRIKRSWLKNTMIFILTLAVTIGIGLGLKGLLLGLGAIAIGFGLYRLSAIAERAHNAITSVTDNTDQNQERWNQLYGNLINQPKFRWLEEHWRAIGWSILIPMILIFLPIRQLFWLVGFLVVIVLVSSARVTQSSLRGRVKMPKEFDPAKPPPPIQPSKVALIYFPLRDHPELCIWAPSIMVGLYLAFKLNLLSKILLFGPTVFNFIPIGVAVMVVVLILVSLPWAWFFILVWKLNETSVDPINHKVDTSIPIGWIDFGGKRITASADIKQIKQSTNEIMTIAFFRWVILCVWITWNPGFAFTSSEEVHQAFLPAWWILWFEAYRNNLS